MKNKVIVIFEILAVFILYLFILFKDGIPRFKSSLGSSDHFISTNKYNNMFEINIDNSIDFALVIDEDDNIYHIMFLNQNAVCLYNHGIENHSINDGSVLIVKRLIEDDYLKDLSTITITRYGDNGYNDFKNGFFAALKSYKLNNSVIELSSSLDELASRLKIEDSSSKDQIIREIDLYSKNFSLNGNTKKNEQEKSDGIDPKTARKYTNTIYKKIERYIIDNRIENMDKNSQRLSIYLIPADGEGKFYPTKNSWYYVKDSKIYAYIELNDGINTYGYCYSGSIDSYKEGVCL